MFLYGRMILKEICLNPLQTNGKINKVSEKSLRNMKVFGEVVYCLFMKYI